MECIDAMLVDAVPVKDPPPAPRSPDDTADETPSRRRGIPRGGSPHSRRKVTK